MPGCFPEFDRRIEACGCLLSHGEQQMVAPLEARSTRIRSATREWKRYNDLRRRPSVRSAHHSCPVECASVMQHVVNPSRGRKAGRIEELEGLRMHGAEATA